jgi:hypothetical protein
MRHPVVAAQLLRQAQASLDDEASQRPARPARQAEPEPRPEATGSRLVSVTRRARALAVRALSARAT